MSVTGRAIGYIIWSALFALLWWVITEGREGSWGVGAPVVLLAALWVSLAHRRPPYLSVAGLLRFLPFFVHYSIKGGVGVALRALRKTPQLTPGVVEMPSGLPTGPARVFFVYAAGLLPGTLCIEWEGDRLQIHTIDRHSGYREELRLLERRTADLFGLDLRQPEEISK